jgi:hypothetical protein
MKTRKEKKITGKERGLDSKMVARRRKQKASLL